MLKINTFTFFTLLRSTENVAYVHPRLLAEFAIVCLFVCQSVCRIFVNVLCRFCQLLETSKLLDWEKGSPYWITDRRVPELTTVLGSQPAGDVSHKPGGRLPLLSTRPAVTSATLKRAATNFAAR